MGQPLPDAIQNAPELNIGLAVFLKAFYALETERRSFDTLIPWSKIVRYAEYQGFDQDMTDDLLYFISRLDNHVIEKRLTKQKNEDAKRTRNASGKGRSRR